MIYIEDGLYMYVQETTTAPAPYPLKSGFSANKAYRVVGAYNASETSEAYMMLTNDRDELWFISNRHMRFAGLDKSSKKSVLELSCFEEKTAKRGTLSVSS